MSTKFQFSSTEDEQLVDLVAAYPTLYDPSHADYKDHMLKENIWREISDKVGRRTPDCRKRWRNIRDTYMKQKRPGATKGRSKWSLMGHLDFLNKVVYARNQSKLLAKKLLHKNEQSDDDLSAEPEEQDEDPLILATNNSKPAQKRKLLSKPSSKRFKDNTGQICEKRSTESEKIMQNINGRRNIERDHGVLMFFKSMAVTVKTFPPELIVEAKSKIFEIVSNLELQSIRQSQEFSQEHFLTNFPDSRPGTPNSDIGSYRAIVTPETLSLSSDDYKL